MKLCTVGGTVSLIYVRTCNASELNIGSIGFPDTSCIVVAGKKMKVFCLDVAKGALLIFLASENRLSVIMSDLGCTSTAALRVTVGPLVLVPCKVI